jgi:ADP-heptose:LPS heptosyltransferase
VPVRAGDVNNHLGFLYQYRFTYRDLPTAVVERFRPLLVQLTGTDDLRWMPITPDRFGGRGGMEKLAAAGWNGRPYVTLAFGTRGLPKRWFPEEENWPALGRLLQDRGYDVVWLGGPDDAQQGRALSARVPGSYDLSGRTTIPEVCALQHAAAGNISIDTGLAHTAAGSGRPTVMINGISPEPLIHPLGPITLTVRGPSVDTEAASRTFETYGSSSFRIHPERILNLLEALMREDAGVPPHSGSGLQSAEGSRFWAPAPDRP